MSRPVIGICDGASSARAGVLGRGGARARDDVRRTRSSAAGGIAVLLPPDPRAREDAGPWLDVLDGAAPHRRRRHRPTPTAPSPSADDGSSPSATRSSSRSRAARWSATCRVLGVCRGMQVMNVARGGTLIQHLPDTVGHEDHRRTPGSFDRRPRRAARRRLARRARRAARRSTRPSRTTTRASTASARGSRSPAGRRSTTCPRRSRTRRSAFALGVQWHPEADEASPLIAALVERRGRGRSMTLTVLEPATEQVLARAAARRRRGGRRGGRARQGRLPGLARGRAGRPRAAAAPASPTRWPSAQEELAVLEARNAGKPIGDARGEMGMVVDTFRYYAGAPERALGDTIPVAGGVAMTFREPLGVVALITPWNFPLTIASWKLAPALAAGNTVVLKPAELTPLTALEFERIALEAGIPEGVVNVVVGPGSTAGARLVEHPDVAKVAFTGSTEVGRRIAAARGRDDQARDARAGRQVGQRRVRRRRPRGRRRGRAGRRVRQRRPGLLRALADPRRALGARRVHGRAGGGSRGDPGRRPARRGDRDGPADLGRPARDGRVVRAGRRAGRDPGQRARRPRLLVPADRPVPGRPRRPRGARGDLRPGRRRRAVPRRGRGGRAGQRHDLRPLGLDLDARRRQGAARRARASRPACCRSTPTRRCASRRRSAASSSRATAASSGPHALDHYTEVKTVYYATS